MRLLAAALAAALLTAACGRVGYKAHPASSEPQAPPPLEVHASTAAARAEPELPVREPGDDTLYYSDLGPETVDVSGYPAQQRYNYAVYAKTCARCHTLARSVNAPAVSRAFWEFYVARMRLYKRLAREPRIPKPDLEAVLDFLEYDSQVRKTGDKRRFERDQDELKRRFEEHVRRRLRQLQESEQPRVLSESDR